MSTDDEGADGSNLWSSLADLVVYAPIGLTLDAQDLAPDLARRGRQHTAAARRIGEFAVKAGMRRLDELVVALDPARAQGAAESPGPAPARSAATAAENRPAADAATPAVDDDTTTAAAEESVHDETVSLAIPDYDLLAASQVVKRLDGLDPDQLDAIRRHEEAGRGRRTILHKITRLETA